MKCYSAVTKYYWDQKDEKEIKNDRKELYSMKEVLHILNCDDYSCFLQFIEYMYS